MAAAKAVNLLLFASSTWKNTPTPSRSLISTVVKSLWPIPHPIPTGFQMSHKYGFGTTHGGSFGEGEGQSENKLSIFIHQFSSFPSEVAVPFLLHTSTCM